jgi:hypothetical protein
MIDFFCEVSWDTSRALKLLLTMLFMIGLSACEPSYSVAWSKNFDKPIQASCIGDALKSLSNTVSQGSYVSDGARGFPKGITVTQFGYPDPHGEGHFDYDIAKIDASRTRISHSFDKVGNRPSDEYLRKSAALLMRNNERVAAMCGLEFSPSDFQDN